MYITTTVAKAIRELKATGLKRQDVADHFGINVKTVDRHCSEKVAKRYRELERIRKQRQYANPVMREILKARIKDYKLRIKMENANV